MGAAFSREPPYKPYGGKIYVQDLMWEDKPALSEAILTGKAYVYVCGDGKSMGESVEGVSMKLLGEAKGGSAKRAAASDQGRGRGV
jgi:NADPH-ferrihemoprotein reductase